MVRKPRRLPLRLRPGHLVAAIYRDATNSQSAFVSLIRDLTPKDQLRVNAQYRQDYFQVPYDPNPSDWEQASQYYESYGLRDGQTERDSFAIANWVHTLSPKALFLFAPFYHYNRANYDSPANDNPVATTWHQGSNYVGGQGDVHADAGPNNFSGGIYIFYQAEDDLFGVLVNDGTAPRSPTPGPTRVPYLWRLPFRPPAAGSILHAARRRAILQLPRRAEGVRNLSPHRRNGRDSSPPLGAARLLWTLLPARATGNCLISVLNYAGSLQSGENTFTPLPSERDEEHQFGIQIP